MAHDRRPARRHGQSRVSAARRRRAMLHLERLEERCVPASIVMTGFTESELRQAIVTSNTTPEADTITYPTSIFRLEAFFERVNTVVLSGSQLPTVTGTLTIVANPSQFTPSFQINASFFSRIFQVAPTGNLTVVNATLYNGAVAGDGGAILNQGSLRLDNVTIVNNQARRGGGIFSSGPSLLLNNSSITANAAAGPDAAAVTAAGQFRIGSDAQGGGLAIAGGSVTITGSTISGNIVRAGRGGSGATGVSAADYTSRASAGEDGKVGANGTAGFSGQSGGPAQGGGIWLSQGNLRIVSSAITENSARGGDGGNGGNGGDGGNGQDGGTAVGAAFGGQAGYGGTGGNGGAGGSAGGGGTAQGGGLFHAGGAGTLEILNSTVAANDATGGYGGDGGVGGVGGNGGRPGSGATTGSEIVRGGTGGVGGTGGNAGTSGPIYGGGIFFEGSDATSRFVNTTIAYNQLVARPGNRGEGGEGGLGGQPLDSISQPGFGGARGSKGFFAPNLAIEGGGIGSFGLLRSTVPLTLLNTIVAQNTYLITGVPLLSLDKTGVTDISATLATPGASLSNLIGTGGAGGLSNGVSGNRVGVSDPGLGPLGNNGGTTPNVPISFSSPAKDAGDGASATAFGLTTDQRGVARTVGPRVDIGAFELRVSYVVSTLVDEDSNSPDPTAGTGVSLREAITLANATSSAGSPQAITFAPGLSGTIPLVSELPGLTGVFTIRGPSQGDDSVVISGSRLFRVFRVDANASIVLDRLGISDGLVSDRLGGGGVLNQGNLEIRNSSIARNEHFRPNSSVGGGGIYNAGTLRLSNSTLFANRADTFGGGLFNAGTATIINTTIAGNSSYRNSGGIYNKGPMTLSNSIVSNNSAEVHHDFGNTLASLLTGSHNVIRSGVGFDHMDDLITDDPKLGGFDNYGGGLGTLAIPLDSPAHNAGDNSVVPDDLTTDQRGAGYGRIRAGTVDLGAFEFQADPPTIARSLASVSTNEASPAINDGTFNDPQGRGTVIITASVGTVTKNDAGRTWSWSYIPTDSSAAPTTVTITATDDTGLTATATFTLDVANVAPTVGITGGPPSGSSPEASPIVLGSSVSDPSAVDAAAGFTYVWTVTRNGVAYASATSAGFTFVPDDGTYVVTLTATDKDGGVSQPVSRTITVTNVAPTIALSGARTSPAGSAYTLTLGAVTDPGADTISQYIVHWGDGTSDTYTTPGAKTHVYNGVGTTRIPRVDLVDEDGTYTDVGSQFLAPVASAAGSNASHLATGDFNRDGRLDLVVSNSGTSDDTVRILMGLAGGGFAAPVAYQTGLGPNDVVVADFNRDGSPDIAASNAYTQDVAILLNLGNGTFSPAMTYSIFGSPVDLAVADFDRNGAPDLAVAALGSDQVHVLLNDGNGGLGLAGSYDVQAISLLAVAAGDFNGDGAPDIAAVGGTSETLSILTNDGGGGFSLTAYQSTGALPVGLAAGDLDGDGAVDLAIAEFGNSSVSIFRNTGGTLGFANRLAVGGSPTSIAIGDLDNDGSPDLAVASGAVVSILRNAGSGAFLPAVDYNAGGANVVAIGDLDSDGVPDIAATNPGAGTISLLSRRTVVITKAGPTATLTAPTTVAEGQSFAVSLAGPTAGLLYSFGTSTDGVNWSDDTPTASNTRTLQFPDNGTFYVRGRVFDADGGVGIASQAVDVTNADPTINGFNVPTGPVATGTAFSLSATATDPAGALDPLTYTWTLTDPSGTPTTLTGASVNFTPAATGTWSISLTVTDGEGGSATRTSSLVVVPLQITQFSVKVGTTWVSIDPASNRSLPWSNLRAFRIAFNGDPSRFTLADLGLTGVRFGNYLAGASFSADAASSTVTVTLADASAIGSDAWAAKLGKSGDRLSLAIGGLGLSFSVLPGDINGDGVVNLLDVNAVQLAMRPGIVYNAFADLNGDGVVDAADLALARRWAGSVLR